MKFAEPPRRAPTESIVPMINVVFLLLIFFLMTAEIAPPEPFDVMPPEAKSDTQAEGEPTVYLDAEGQMAFGEARGEVATLATLAAAREAACKGCEGADAPPVVLRADAGVATATVAALLAKLARAGFAQVLLITAAP